MLVEHSDLTIIKAAYYYYYILYRHSGFGCCVFSVADAAAWNLLPHEVHDPVMNYDQF